MRKFPSTNGFTRYLYPHEALGGISKRSRWSGIGVAAALLFISLSQSAGAAPQCGGQANAAKIGREDSSAIGHSAADYLCTKFNPDSLLGVRVANERSTAEKRIKISVYSTWSQLTSDRRRNVDAMLAGDGLRRQFEDGLPKCNGYYDQEDDDHKHSLSAYELKVLMDVTDLKASLPPPPNCKPETGDNDSGSQIPDRAPREEHIAPESHPTIMYASISATAGGKFDPNRRLISFAPKVPTPKEVNPEVEPTNWTMSVSIVPLGPGTCEAPRNEDVCVLSTLKINLLNARRDNIALADTRSLDFSPVTQQEVAEVHLDQEDVYQNIYLPRILSYSKADLGLKEGDPLPLINVKVGLGVDRLAKRSPKEILCSGHSPEIEFGTWDLGLWQKGFRTFIASKELEAKFSGGGPCGRHNSVGGVAQITIGFAAE